MIFFRYLLLILIVFISGCDQHPSFQGEPQFNNDTSLAGSNNISKLISSYEYENDKCRGGSGDDPKTFEFCDRRDVIFKQITNLGWCWGEPDQAEYQKSWHKCT